MKEVLQDYNHDHYDCWIPLKKKYFFVSYLLNLDTEVKCIFKH